MRHLNCSEGRDPLNKITSLGLLAGLILITTALLHGHLVPCPKSRKNLVGLLLRLFHLVSQILYMWREWAFPFLNLLNSSWVIKRPNCICWHFASSYCRVSLSSSVTICHRLDSSSDLVFSFPRYSILEENEIPEVDFKSDRHLQRELGSAPREATVANDLPTSRHSSIYMHADGEFA